MLLSQNGVYIDQKKIVELAKVGSKIKEKGMTLEELATAVKKLTDDFCFCFKRNATLKELVYLVNNRKIPVGVEWQGVFEDEDEDENEDDDPGHYSVITAIDEKKKKVFIADPSIRYAGHDREFSILQFLRRWWDINEVTNPATKRTRQVDDYHSFFVIVKKKTEFPKELGLKTI